MNLRIRRLLAIIIDFKLSEYVLKYTLGMLQLKYQGTIIEHIIVVIILLVIPILLFKKDCLIGYESIGKKLMFLKIYQNGKPVKDKKILTQRIIKTFWTIPFYPFMIIKNNKSEGDIICNTEVKSSISKKLKF